MFLSIKSFLNENMGLPGYAQQLCDSQHFLVQLKYPQVSQEWEYHVGVVLSHTGIENINVGGQKRFFHILY